MSFSFEKSFYDLLDRYKLNSILTDPIYVSIIVVLVVVIIIYFIFRTSIDNEENSFWRLETKFAVYTIIPIFLVLFIHYKLLKKEFEKKGVDKATERVVKDSNGAELNTTSTPPPLLVNQQQIQGPITQAVTQ